MTEHTNTGDPGSVPWLEDPLKKGMAAHFNLLAWRVPWTKEPGRLQSMGSQRVRHDRETNTNTKRHTYVTYDPGAPNGSPFFLLLNTDIKILLNIFLIKPAVEVLQVHKAIPTSRDFLEEFMRLSM